MADVHVLFHESRKEFEPKPNKISLLITIFYIFFKINPATFGGGYAIIPLLERELVQKKKWFEIEEIADIFAVSGSLPGAVAINSGTFIGYRLAGIPGAVAGLLGSVLPTFLILLIFSMVFYSYQNNPIVQALFRGIRPAVVGLILYASYKLGMASFINKKSRTDGFIQVGIFLLTLILLFLNIHPFLTIIMGAVLGISLIRFR